MSSNKKLLQGASGFLNLSGSLNIEDVFSTDVYTGNATARSITNGIDLSGEGGLVWGKSRSAYYHWLYDTARGAEKPLVSNTNGAESSTSGAGLTAFNSDGFSLAASSWWNENQNNVEAVAWTFRKAPNFFDVVTYTGNGVNGRTVSHNLGSVPGMIIIKQTSASGENWYVQHRYDTTKKLYLNTNAEASDGDDGFQNTAPTSSVFTVAYNGTNKDGATYVAYVFGHDTSSDGMIQCGEFTTDSSGDYDGLDDLGFEPQWIMIKGYEHSGLLTSWVVSDHVRGLHTGANDKAVLPDQSGAEFSQEMFDIGAEGFKVHNFPNSSASGKFIYMAIRRGPMATPTSRADVFNLDTTAYTGADAQYPAFGVANFADFVIVKNRSTTEDVYANSRMQGGNYLETNSNAAEASGSGVAEWDYMTGAWVNAQNNGRGAYIWSRAPEFFDVVMYTGNGSAGRQINHNLGATPEMIWVKLRGTYTDNWVVYHSGLTSGHNLLGLDTNAASADYSSRLHSPSSTIFTVSSDTSVNSNTLTYVAYLFATLAGISKVGTFSHTNGSTTDVNCGFSSGTYWVVVKRKDSTGDWFVFDIGANIGAGNDSYIVLNSDAGEVGSSNYIAQLNSGFTMESDFPTGDYIFYAIAN